MHHVLTQPLEIPLSKKQLKSMRKKERQFQVKPAPAPQPSAPAAPVSKIIYARVVNFKIPTGETMPSGAKKCQKGEGYGFASIDGINHYFHIAGCYRFSAKGCGKEKLTLVANCAGHSDELDGHPLLPEEDDTIIVISKGDGNRGKAIFKWAHKSQLEEVKAEIACALEYRVIQTLCRNGKVVKSDGEPTPVWQGNNPHAVCELFGKMKRERVPIGRSDLPTVLQLQAKLPWDSVWIPIELHQVKFLPSETAKYHKA